MAIINGGGQNDNATPSEVALVSVRPGALSVHIAENPQKEVPELSNGVDVDLLIR